ncbi:MAG: hypothetical protein R3E95_13610 [Thiolinea sp.]
MLTHTIDGRWISAFEQVFELCLLNPDEQTIILSETHSRALNVQLAELALQRMGIPYFHIKLPSRAPQAGLLSRRPQASPPILRSTGASLILHQQAAAVQALSSVPFIVDLSVEGLMHAKETAGILQNGARIMTVSNEHPEILTRLLPRFDLKEQVLAAVKRCRNSRRMTVTSKAGTRLEVDMQGCPSVGVWGWTDKPSTLAHWPGGMVVSFPKKGTVNGRLVFQPGDMNLTFKRYFDSEVVFTLENDYVTHVGGDGTEAMLMRQYLKAFDDPQAWSTSHVGWGMNPQARHEALTMYDRCDHNGTELRAVAGNFLYSTGANEFAGRFTEGHFDLPMLGCTILLDGVPVVQDGRLL